MVHRFSLRCLEFDGVVRSVSPDRRYLFGCALLLSASSCGCVAAFVGFCCFVCVRRGVGCVACGCGAVGELARFFHGSGLDVAALCN